MTRRESRESAFQVLFALSLNGIDCEDAIELANLIEEPMLDEFALRLVRTTIKYISEIDAILIPNLNDWSINRLSKVTLAILRLSCAQLFYWTEIDDEVEGKLHRIVIDEAVRITKAFGTDDEYIYVNGVLGTIVRTHLDTR